MVDGVRDDLRVNGKVRVYQTVAHGPHQMPWHLRVRSLDLFRDMARGFADNDEVKRNGPHSFGIIPQRLECYPLCEGLDFSDCVQSIPYALGPGSRRHQCSPFFLVHCTVPTSLVHARQRARGIRNCSEKSRKEGFVWRDGDAYAAEIVDYH